MSSRNATECVGLWWQWPPFVVTLRAVEYSCHSCGKQTKTVTKNIQFGYIFRRRCHAKWYWLETKIDFRDCCAEICRCLYSFFSLSFYVFPISLSLSFHYFCLLCSLEFLFRRMSEWVSGVSGFIFLSIRMFFVCYKKKSFTINTFALAVMSG